ncbi:MAG: CPBP family intramembrane glutamic endopeptidase [Nitrospira sp.]
MVNAAVEELAYRGVVLHALERTVGAGEGALCAQASAFGVLHVNGFPPGFSGILLAMVFGLLMGVIRRKSHRLFAPWAAHVCADIVIVAIVLLLVGRHPAQ